MNYNIILIYVILNNYWFWDYLFKLKFFFSIEYGNDYEESCMIVVLFR